MRRGTTGCLVVVVAAAGVLVALAVWSAPPPAQRVQPGPADRRVVRGSLHVHTRRSDGAGTVADVAGAAHAAGLDFVVFTDHGDGTRPPDPPRYVDGVLCLDAVEISTTGGHYVALGLPRAPYRLAGDPGDVVEDVARLGGFGIAAHPESIKPELRWTAWDAGIDGLEWLNGDSAWRDERPLSLARAFATYWVRAPETMARLLGPEPDAFREWDRLGRERPVVGVAGHDAHARIALGSDWEPRDTDLVLRLPSYESAFRTFAVRARLPKPFAGAPAADAALLLDAIRAGHVFTVVDAFAGPAVLEMTARADLEALAEMGDTLHGTGAVRIDAAVTPVGGVHLALLRDGEVVARANAPVLQYEHAGGLGRAVYRVEAFLDERSPRRVPWIVGNPIYVGAPADRLVTRVLDVARREPLSMEIRPGEWTTEREPRSEAALAPDGEAALRFAWRLSEGAPHGQYAAAVRPLPRGRVSEWDQLAFRASADAPMRVSVQVRAPNGDRWGRSVYLDTTPRDVVLQPPRPASGGAPSCRGPPGWRTWTRC